jgi:hypothetical protein
MKDDPFAKVDLTEEYVEELYQYMLAMGSSGFSNRLSDDNSDNSD